jgi:hypothetical protein
LDSCQGSTIEYLNQGGTEVAASTAANRTCHNTVPGESGVTMTLPLNRKKLISLPAKITMMRKEPKEWGVVERVIDAYNGGSFVLFNLSWTNDS